jgi:hypothetical protein
MALAVAQASGVAQGSAAQFVGGLEHGELIREMGSWLAWAADEILTHYGIDGNGRALYFDVDNSLTTDFPHMYVRSPAGSDDPIGIYVNARMIERMLEDTDGP